MHAYIISSCLISVICWLECGSASWSNASGLETNQHLDCSDPWVGPISSLQIYTPELSCKPRSPTPEPLVLDTNCVEDMVFHKRCSDALFVMWGPNCISLPCNNGLLLLHLHCCARSMKRASFAACHLNYVAGT
eukprot:GHRR01033115.1.p1 GENE.GHRR01033115.1~~GHRR01033115.1.p1  ORF type:complete len:134 (-),score=1.17 GHRR01033115.1:311-712(-)